MIITGIYKGSKRKDYDFVNSKGESIKGTSNTAFIECDDEGMNPDERLQSIKLPSSDYVCVSEVGKKVSWIYSVRGNKMVLVSETSLKKV